MLDVVGVVVGIVVGAAEHGVVDFGAVDLDPGEDLLVFGVQRVKVDGLRHGRQIRRGRRRQVDAGGRRGRGGGGRGGRDLLRRAREQRDAVVHLLLALAFVDLAHDEASAHEEHHQGDSGQREP